MVWKKCHGLSDIIICRLIQNDQQFWFIRFSVERVLLSFNWIPRSFSENPRQLEAIMVRFPFSQSGRNQRSGLLRINDASQQIDHQASSQCEVSTNRNQNLDKIIVGHWQILFWAWSCYMYFLAMIMSMLYHAMLFLQGWNLPGRKQRRSSKPTSLDWRQKRKISAGAPVCRENSPFHNSQRISSIPCASWIWTTDPMLEDTWLPSLVSTSGDLLTHWFLYVFLLRVHKCSSFPLQWTIKIWKHLNWIHLEAS